MASNKEILEAQRFNRRRLITAFSSGMPHGKELPPTTPGRPLILGIVISLLILAGASVASFFSPVLPANWENSTLIVVKGTGARYFTINGTLRPVSNVTSARLLAEAGAFQISSVSPETIVGIPRGSAVGLIDIPDDVPASSALASEKWLSCPVGQATYTWVAGLPQGPESAQTALVQHGDDLYLVANGKRHKIAAQDKTSVSVALKLDALTPVHISAKWLALFQRGSDLLPLEIPNAGSPVAGMPAKLASAVKGTIIEVDEETETRAYIVTGNGTITRLSPTAKALYSASRSIEISGNPLKASVAELSELTVAPSNDIPSDWPETTEGIVEKDALPCAGLASDDNGLHTALFAWPTANLRTLLNQQPTPTNDEADRVIVPGGAGALVRASSGGTLGSVTIITDDGNTHGLGANPLDSLARLGWEEKDILTIPAEWVALVPSGAELIPQAAWETVAQQ